jgi:N-methylhydantoinase A
VVIDAEGSRVAKVASTPSDPSEGVLAAVEAVAADVGLSVRRLLESCSHFVHGSTVATNIVVERRGAPTGMLVTRGFRDSLEIRRGIRLNAWDHRRPFPPVLVPRYLRLAVGGRIDRHGVEVEPLALGDVDRARHPDGRCRRWPSVSTTASATRMKCVLPSACWRDIPVLGDTRAGSRRSWANMSAAPPRDQRLYCAACRRLRERLADALSQRGLRSPLLVVQNNGGSLTVESVRERPAALLLSGPAAGVGALRLCGEALGTSDLLSVEIGGTSCDVTLLSQGGAEIASEFDLGGYHVALPSVDIHSIGAGGGTIAAVDASGMLFVGPRGAGAEPGPASYGRGGTDATVTDAAQLVLGRLKSGPLAGGRSLDLALARTSIEERIAKPLGLSLDEAAAGILTLVEEQLFQAVQKISAERGHDPRRFVLVAAGGRARCTALPSRASSLARRLHSALREHFCALACWTRRSSMSTRASFCKSSGRRATPELRPTLTGWSRTPGRS